MEQTVSGQTASTRRGLFAFHGKGEEFFVIWIVNLFLTVITLGLYYPWARVRTLRFFYGNLSFAGSRFVFTGNGNELFVGWLLAYAILIAISGTYTYGQYTGNEQLQLIGLGIFVVGQWVLVPFAIHGMMRYRLSRTEWRGVRMGYRGERQALVKRYFMDTLLTLVTLGLYSFWLIVRMRKYVIGNSRFGQVTFQYTGSGWTYFSMVLVAYFLMLPTLGIYLLFFERELLKFLIEKIEMNQGEKRAVFRIGMGGWEFVGILITNALLVVITLGLAAPWARVRMFKKVSESLVMLGSFDENAIEQTEDRDAASVGENLVDLLDLGIV